ncbi:hypothetical protein FOA52_016231 [Chlamydomonas sp. UWO 241]|nr:hypothetical protein FOA52_016231 [Chlamydomonas sp. UWO 241]
MKGGELQRFCSACRRYHPASAFDGVQKSCRDCLQQQRKRYHAAAELKRARNKAGGSNCHLRTSGGDVPPARGPAAQLQLSTAHAQQAAQAHAHAHARPSPALGGGTAAGLDGGVGGSGGAGASPALMAATAVAAMKALGLEATPV